MRARVFPGTQRVVLVARDTCTFSRLRPAVVSEVLKTAKAPEFSLAQVITLLQHQAQTREATKEGTASAAAKRQAWKDLAAVVNSSDPANTYVYTVEQVRGRSAICLRNSPF